MTYFILNKKRYKMKDLYKIIDELVDDVSVLNTTLHVTLDEWLEIENKLNEKDESEDE